MKLRVLGDSQAGRDMMFRPERKAFPRSHAARGNETIFQYNERPNFLFATKTRRARRKNKLRIFVVKNKLNTRLT